MITLGLASTYNFPRALRHLFACGTRKSSARLREELAAAYGAGVQNVALYHSGRSALTVAIEAVLEENREPADTEPTTDATDTATPAAPTANNTSRPKVIIPGLTCIAVVRAVRAAGCEPVFCDITPDNLSYDLAMLDKLAKVCYNGIIVVQNTLGLTCDVVKIETIARRHGLKIVEDLAHSAGRFYPDGRRTGTVGASVALSFGKGKSIDTITGGAVILLEPRPGYQLQQPLAKPRPSERLRDRWYPVFAGLVRAFWRLGLGPKLLAGFVRLHWIEKSADTRLDTNARLTHWQASLARRQFRALSASPKPGPLREFALVARRPELLEQLRVAHYYFEESWYMEPVSPARYADEAGFPAATCPATVRIAATIINLPTWYPEQKLLRARQIIQEYRHE